MKRAASFATAVATVGTMLLPVAPLRAASLEDTSDTLSREQISVTSVNHTLSTTLPSISTDTMIVFAYGTAGFASLSQGTATGACASGTCTLTVSATDVKITCTSGPCSGLFTQTNAWTATNPGTAGSKLVSYTSEGYGDPVSGSFAIPIVDSDQVTVTATVDPSITFDIDTQSSANALPNTTETSAPYSVALGTITTTDTRVSGTTDGVNYIMLDLDTNASGGAVITVRNANGANGLVSTAVPADDIDSASAAVTDGSENYGICVVDESATTGTLTPVAPFNGSCTGDTEGNTVGGFTGSAQDILNTGGAPIAVGRAMIAVQASIDALTTAHNDYTDTLTFIATGTF